MTLRPVVAIFVCGNAAAVAVTSFSVRTPELAVLLFAKRRSSTSALAWRSFYAEAAASDGLLLRHVNKSFTFRCS